MFWLKLKAGALQLTLFVAVVITLLLTAFILLVHTHKLFNIQTDFIIETVKIADEGIYYSINNPILLNDTTTVNLGVGFKTLKVHRDYWGVFEKVSSISKIKNNTFKKVALIGATQPENNQTALYIQNNNKPLVLVGNTKIEGVTYLPERGVKPGTISGQSYYGSQLIYGQTKTASNLPKLFNETLTKLNTIDRRLSKTNENLYLNLEQGKTFINSFFNEAQLIFSNRDLNISSVELVGNIIVQSKTKITVHSSAILKDVILIAPKIYIQNKVKGNFQAIATKQVTVGKNVTLNYPSALILNEKEKTLNSDVLQKNNTNKISVDNNTTIKGLVLYLGQPKSNNYNAQIDLKEKSTVIGEVYCNKNVELRGTVHGTVYVNNFIAKQFGSIYQNHIYNGTIIAKKLPQEYIGLSFNNSNKDVLKWLY